MKKKNKLAYVRVIDKVRLPEKYHKGKKLMNAERQEVCKLYATGDYTYRALAEYFGVSYGVIQVIINPNAKKCQAAAGKRWRLKTGYKPDTDCMELRRRKKAMIMHGLITI